jgi:hypothetical protein
MSAAPTLEVKEQGRAGAHNMDKQETTGSAMTDFQKVTLRCTGCGSFKTIEQIRKDNPTALSCCPEREMHPFTLEDAIEQIKDHELSFDLRWKADMRAIKRWQADGEGRELTWPDHADLVVWLLEKLERAGPFPTPLPLGNRVL